MSLATIFEIPQAKEQWQRWGFANMAHHRDIIRRTQETRNVSLTESLLDPFNYDEPGTWLVKHYLMHLHQNQTLGIAGFDLEQVDWHDPDQMQAWFANHANEHYQAAQILGLS